MNRPAKCGTDSGYHAHRHRGEPACDKCKAAHSLYERRRTARKSERPPNPAGGRGYPAISKTIVPKLKIDWEYGLTRADIIKARGGL